MEIKIHVNILVSEWINGDKENEQALQILAPQIKYKVLPTQVKRKLEEWFNIPINI